MIPPEVRAIADAAAAQAGQAGAVERVAAVLGDHRVWGDGCFCGFEAPFVTGWAIHVAETLAAAGLIAAPPPPTDPCFCRAVPNIGGGGCGKDGCPRGPELAESVGWDAPPP